MAAQALDTGGGDLPVGGTGKVPRRVLRERQRDLLSGSATTTVAILAPPQAV